MLGNKDSAAVLVRKDRCLIGINLNRDIYDVLFIKGDKWPVNRHVFYHFTCTHKALHSLGCYLSDALAGYKSHASGSCCQDIRDLHHISSHDDGELVVWALLIYVHLNIGKVDNVKLDVSCVLGDDTCQVDNLLLGLLTGVWRSIEVNSLQINASLGNHVACNR